MILSKTNIYIPGKGNEQLFLHDLDLECDDGVHLKVDAHIPDEPLIVRHLARYHFLSGFCRSGNRVLDFPCGSGYGVTLMPRSVRYEGRDLSDPSIRYAKSLYGHLGTFIRDDLTNPHLDNQVEGYDVIGCIEGLEHIDRDDQLLLVPRLAAALTTTGLLIISSPESNRGVSSANPLNKYHRHELIRDDFEALIHRSFSWVEIVTQVDRLHTGEVHRCFYAVCRNPR
jgi:2-polyprenyl-3-methyl-5-hydroxy-6-metoxy-1,4-benzoquinol methylase